MKIDLTRAVPSFLFAASIVLASFSPSIRIDHNDIPTNWMQSPAITLGPKTSGVQPIYVAFQRDSLLLTGLANTVDIMFQKSTDGGRTWLPQDVFVQRGAPLAEWPDITTDTDGNIYIVYIDDPDSMDSHYDCVRSSDGGITWSTPVYVRGFPYSVARVAVDSAGNLFVVWTANHVYSSVSTDKGLTWSPRVRVDDDTVPSECYSADPYVQPGTNDYLVVASVPYYHSGGYIAHHAYLYRSTDMGRTFEPGVQLDSSGAGRPHVVADAQHVICDYICKSELPDQLVTESRTCYAPADTWGSRVLVTELDTPYITYVQGSTMAISGDGRVHTALMLGNGNTAHYLAYYVCSSDHGASWSDRELVSDDTTSEAWQEDIGADSSGHAYVVWQQFRYDMTNRGQIWFATNNPLAVAEQPVRQPISVQPSATVVRNVLFLPKMGAVPSGTVPIFGPSLLDASGRKVLDLKPGANDVSRLSPGVYFVRQQGSRGPGFEDSRVTKIVVTR